MYCDFKSRDNITWTMVQSYMVDNFPFAGFEACYGREARYAVHSPFYFHNLVSVDNVVFLCCAYRLPT
jgi:hypothetical protein